MNRPADTVVVDGDRIDESSRTWPVVVAALVIGAIIGGLFGLLYGSLQPRTYEASTALSVLPDPTLDLTSSNSSNNSNVATLDPTAYIQSALVVINGHQLATTVQGQLKLASPPSVTATEVGETYVVQLQSSSTNRTQALNVVRAVADTYRTIRSAQLEGEIDDLVASTNKQLATVQSSLAASRSRGNANSALTPTQTALQTQYEQLLANRSSLEATRVQARQDVTVVSSPNIVTAGLSATEKAVIGGIVIGAIIGLVVLLVVRRTVRRVRGVGDLAALGVPVLLPVQPRRSGRSARPGPAFWQAPAARLLAARLHADALAYGRPVVLVGARPRVGTSQVAATVAAALAGRGSVLLVTESALVSSETGPSAPAASSTSPAAEVEVPAPVMGGTPAVPSSIPGVWLLRPPPAGDASDGHRTLGELAGRATVEGWLVVVDADAISGSDLASHMAHHGAAVALVVGRGRSTPSEVLAATELFEAEQVAGLGAVLNDVPGPVRQWLARRPGARRGSRVEPAHRAVRDDRSGGTLPLFDDPTGSDGAVDPTGSDGAVPSGVGASSSDSGRQSDGSAGRHGDERD